MEAATDPPPSSEPDEAKNESEYDALMLRAQNLMAKVISSQANPNPKLLHALASLLENEESRYVQESGHSSFSNGRASHNIGRLGNLVRENDEFFELVSSKFLSESRYSLSIRSAAARLLLACSPTWLYPHVFEDVVLENIKGWVMDGATKVSGDEDRLKFVLDKNKPSDSDMLRAYATGLLALALTGGGQVVEDVLTSGLSAKLMRFLRLRVLGESNLSQKDSSFLTEGKHASGATFSRGREENKGRIRQVSDATRGDGSRTGDEGLLDDRNAEMDLEASVGDKQLQGDECLEDGAETTGDDKRLGKDLRDGKSKYGDADENVRDDSSRRRANRGCSRVRGVGEGVGETERTLTSPVAGLRLGGQGRHIRDRHQSKVADSRKAVDAKKDSSRIAGEIFCVERDDNDDCFKECKIGTKDISDLVKKATMAAEAEARSANAPVEAIKAAGDAAAELVKTAALESLKSTNDEDAALLAASKAASTVVDAAAATEISRSCCNVTEESLSSRSMEPENDEELGFFILDAESLAQMREQYCIQCLEVLGEYVEVLGPVLHEKGVDVCLALLQRSSKSKEASRIMIMLPEVLKLICALAAHRKFAALFVDRGGMQKLLAVQRVSQTFTGLSLCLFTIGSLQGIMERVCALPSDVVHQLVELALQLLECSQDQARKNAALFFAAAFVFRGVLDSFDTQDGLQKMLNVLHSAASVRSGVNPGTLGLSNLAALRNERAPAEVLTASEKQIAYHTCVALRQYFRAHLLLIVDALRPNKSHRSGARNIPSARAAYKPLDISNEAMDVVFLQLQRDRKLGPAFVRARWSAVDRFLSSNGHTTLLELCQAPPVERYLHDLAQYALGVLHIITLVPYSRKPIITATLSNERLGMAVILDAANGAGYVDPEVIHPALNLLVNLVCPPPCFSNKPFVPLQGQQNVSVQSLNGPVTENRERNVERNISDRTVPLPIQSELRERNGEPCTGERGGSVLPATPGGSLSAMPSIASGVVGDRRISLGPGAGCAGLAAHMELGYRQAREAVRANNGIKILLHLLHPRILTPPAALDCLRALACRVLLGLARDDTIAHILTKLQVGKMLSELIRDSSSQATGAEQQGRWQDELSRAAMELIAIVTNSGRACTLAASDAAAPTLRRIERAAIAAATPISYHSRELLLLMHEHLQASGLTVTADALMKEAQLTPLPCLAALPPVLASTSAQETSSTLFQWPSGHVPNGFLSDTSKLKPRDLDLSINPDSPATCSRKKPLSFSSNLSSQGKSHLQPSSLSKVSSASKNMSGPSKAPEIRAGSVSKPGLDTDHPLKTPIVLPMKRKLMESKDTILGSPVKKVAASDLFQSPVCQTPNTYRRACPEPLGIFVTPNSVQRDSCWRPSSGSILSDNLDDIQHQGTPVGQMPAAQCAQLGLLADPQAGNIERVTLDTLVVQYLKHQHRQCSAPITTLPPLSLLHPHVCPEPSRNLDAPANVTARLSTRECRKQYCSAHSHRRDRQFVFSRFRPWRTCRDDAALLTCITFPGDSSQIVTGSHSGELKIFDSNSGNMLESHSGHQSPITLVQSAQSGGTQLVLSSGTFEVRLWDLAALSGGPMQSFEGCKAARFSHTGAMFAALSSESSRREVLLYDVQTCNLEQKLSDNSATSGPLRSHVHSPIHFSPSDTMLLWNGVLWDRRVDGPLHRFDQFSDYGGGGFHPAGNEVIINSEVWDLRKFKLLRSVPSLDQTVITFNAGGDIIYAILRRNRHVNFSSLFLLFFCFFTLFTSSSSTQEYPSAIISRFQQYLQINTAQPNPNYEQSSTFLISQAKSIGLEFETLEFVKGKPLILLKWPGKNPNLPSILLNSHTDVVTAEEHKWVHPPFSAHLDENGDIFARGSQDMKCVGLQYLEAIRALKNLGFKPIRTVYLSFVPDEEIGGVDGVGMFAGSDKFNKMNVGIVLDEGLASPDENYRIFYGERSPWWLVIRAAGMPGHGSKLYDNSAMENLQMSVERIMRFRAAQFELVKAGLKAEGEVVSVNPVFLKSGTPSPTGFVMNLQPSEAEAGFDIRVPPIADTECLERRIAEEWAPSSRNMTFEFKQKIPTHDMFGNPAVTVADKTNPWWTLLVEAIKKANGKLAKPEIFPASTDARYFRERGLPAIGFSPMANTPILLHAHNEFLNQAEYLKGIKIYEAIIKSYASYAEPTIDEDKAEL